MTDCVFCQIVSNQAPASFVYQDDTVIAIMDINQPNPYKVLVMPRLHVETIYDLNHDQAAAIFQATVNISRAVRLASDCDGLNLVQANGPTAGQDVFHFHLHILPRFTNDDVVFAWDFTTQGREVLDRLATDIRGRMAKDS